MQEDKPIVTMKFGGTSVGNVAMIQAIAQYIREYQQEHACCVVVIVSAMGKETDRIIRLIGEIDENPDPREYDQILQTGEAVSAGLLTLALQGIDVPARSLIASQVQLITTTEHGGAKILGIKDPEKLRDMAQKCVLVVAGFQGIAQGTDEITTLGRGGSDATAIAIAASIKASECLIFTDVDGIYTTDPRIVPSAKRLTEISFNQMISLAASGAGVMMDRSVKIAQAHGLVVRVMLSPSIGESMGGTRITTMGDLKNMEGAAYLAGIAIRKNVGALHISGIPNKPGEAEKIFTCAKGTPIIDYVQGKGDTHASISLLLDTKDIQHVYDELAILPDISIERIDNLVQLTLVDHMMKEGADYALRIARTLAQQEVNIDFTSSSQATIWVAIQKKHLEKATQALAEEFDLTE